MIFIVFIGIIALFTKFDSKAYDEKSEINIIKSTNDLLESNPNTSKKQENLEQSDKDSLVETKKNNKSSSEGESKADDNEITLKNDNKNISDIDEIINNNDSKLSKLQKDKYLNKKMYAKNNLNLRKQPNLNSEILLIIPSDSEVVCNYYSKDFINITYDGISGFSSEEYLTERKLQINGDDFYSSPSEVIIGPTYINGILIVNKKYTLPRSYAPGESCVAREAFNKLKKEARDSGFNLVVFSSYRSYDYQNGSYNNRVKQHGEAIASKWTAKAGQSEHQSGLAFDVGESSRQDQWARKTFHDTEAAKWLKENSHKHGFIIRYPKGKEHITGFNHESWHLRYVGIDHAKEIYKRDITLEEYLGIE